MKVCLQICALFLVLTPFAAFAGKPNWIRRATGFAGQCQSACPSLHIVAPDKTTTVEVLYQEGSAYLRVTQRGQTARARFTTSSPARATICFGRPTPKPSWSTPARA